jgi:imidazolonepropionase-like amidohydrolase
VLTYKNNTSPQIEHRRPSRAPILSWAMLAIWLMQTPAHANAQKTVLTAFDHVTLIDGTGAQPRPNMTVVVSDGLIVDLFTSGQKALPTGARVFDLRGKYMIPGLIDAHVHVATDPAGRDANSPERLRSALNGGVTSVRDMAGDAVVLRTLSSAARDPAFASPRIYYSALMAGPTFFEDPRTTAAAHGGKPGEVAWMRAVTIETDIVKAVESAKATGATGIKLYADIPPALVTRLAAEAHAQGMKVWAHATIYPSRPTDAVRAGVDVISHALLLYWEGVAVVPTRYHQRAPSTAYDSLNVKSGVMDALLRDMKAHNTILDATLFISSRLESAPAGTAGMVDPARAVRWMFDVTARAKELGITVAAGTDGMSPGGPVELPNIHRELELLVTRVGFKPVEAIAAATSNGARAIGIEKTTGTVSVGKVADLVVLTADPSVDIRNTRTVEFVVKGGVIFDRKAFLASVGSRNDARGLPPQADDTH